MHLTLSLASGNAYERVEATWARPLNWLKQERRVHDVATAATFRIHGEVKNTTPRPVNPLPPDVADRQERLRRRMTAAVLVAGQLRQEYPDPIQSLIDLFANLPPDYGQWQDILDEPYG